MKRRTVFGIVLQVLGLSVYNIAMGQQMSIAGAGLWGGMTDVALNGNTAYCLFPYGLVAVDVTDGNHPAERGSVLLTAGQTSFYQLMTATSDRVYVRLSIRNEELPIAVIDTRNPLQPEWRGTISLPTNGVVGMAADESGYLFVQDFGRGIVIFDVRDLDAPVEVATIPRIGTVPSTCGIHGHILSVVEDDSLRIYDVQQPTNPVRLGAVRLTDESGHSVYSDHISVSDGAVFVSGTRCLDVISLTDPQHPFLAGRFSDEHHTFGQSVLFDYYLYCEIGTDRTAMFDIVDLSRPTWMLDLPFHFLRSSVSGTRLAALMGDFESQQLSYLDVTNPWEPAMLGEWEVTSRWPNRAAIAGDHAFITDDAGVMRVVDLSDPAHLRQVFSGPGFGDFSVSSPYCFTAHSENGFSVWDFSDASNPIRRANIPGAFSGAALADHYFYTITRQVSLYFQIFDVANPSEPVALDLVPVGSTYGETPYAVQGDLLFVTGEGLDIYDISDRAHPVLLGRYRDSRIWVEDIVEEVVPQGNTLYIAYEGCGVQILDISNPAHPYCLARYGFEEFRMTSVAVSPPYAVVGGYWQGVRLLDIHEPTNYYELAALDSLGDGSCLLINGGYVYQINSSQMLALQIIPNSADPVSPETVSDFTLAQNYPNPFNGMTQLSYDLPAAGAVELTVVDLLGRTVATLCDEIQTAGTHRMEWNANGRPSGVYFARLQYGERTRTAKMMLLR